MHALSKHLILEDGDGGHWENLDPDPDPDTTSHAAATATSSDDPPYEDEIECKN